MTLLFTDDETGGPTPRRPAWGLKAPGRHRIFFMIRPDAEARAPITALAEGLRRERGTVGPLVGAGRWHVSLNPLGSYATPPGARLAEAKAAVAGLSTRPFRIAFNRVGTWGRGHGSRAVVLWGDEGLFGVHQLHEAIHAALADRGLATGAPRDIRPHLTLMHDRAFVPELVVPPVTWMVRDIVLVNSIYGEGRHDHLGRWPLRG